MAWIKNVKVNFNLIPKYNTGSLFELNGNGNTVGVTGVTYGELQHGGNGYNFTIADCCDAISATGSNGECIGTTSFISFPPQLPPVLVPTKASTINLVCINSEFLDANSKEEVVRRIEYTHLPQVIAGTTGSFYQCAFEDFGIGTRLRNADNTFATASGYLVGSDSLRVGVPDTKERIKEKLWRITSGSLWTIVDGTVTAIEDLSLIEDNLPPLVEIPASGGDFTNKVTAKPDFLFSDFDPTTKSTYNQNASNSVFTGTGFSNREPGSPGPFQVLIGSDTLNGTLNADLYSRHHLQNSPQATRHRRTLPRSSSYQCVPGSPDYPLTFRVDTFPNYVVGGWQTVASLDWTWRGYQYVRGGGGYIPGQTGTPAEVCAYTGSFTETLFISGALKPATNPNNVGPVIYNAPALPGNPGIEIAGGFRSPGTGSNDYFPVLTPDGIKAFLYGETPQSVNDKEILEIKNADGSDYVGPFIERWEGPYFWRGPLYATVTEARNNYSESNMVNPVYIAPFRSLNSIGVGDIVNTAFDIDTGTSSVPLDGQNYYTTFYDYNPAATNPPGIFSGGVDIRAIYQVSATGEIIDILPYIP